MEFRWLVENSKEWCEGFRDYIPIETEPRLQYRERSNPLEAGIHEPIWEGWIDVPTVHVDI